jgi:hypothetical protein
LSPGDASGLVTLAALVVRSFIFLGKSYRGLEVARAGRVKREGREPT